MGAADDYNRREALDNLEAARYQPIDDDFQDRALDR
jgi:hypothetical protein